MTPQNYCRFDSRVSRHRVTHSAAVRPPAKKRNLPDNLKGISLNSHNNKQDTARIQILSHDTKVIKPVFNF
jgi:hypothetical protein